MGSDHETPDGVSPSRRQVIVAALGSGFALAVRPVSAQTISTSDDGLDAGEVKIPTTSGEIPAYRALPRGKSKKLPVILVVHEIFGVHEHIRDVCRRLAKQGYLAIAPELFARQGDVSKLTDPKAIRDIVGKAPDAQVLSDLDATWAWAQGKGAGKDGPKGDPTRLGITGFCWGGRITWLYAAHNPALKAGVAWYGRIVGDKSDLHPHHPIDVAPALKAPVLGLYGAEDQGIPVASVADMQKALAGGSAASRHSEINIYPGAGHAFFADYRPSYRKEAAEDGWSKLLAWMKSHGVV
jgi:carboxymethylenebutenolidase